MRVLLILLLFLACSKDAMLPDGKDPITEITTALCDDPDTLSDQIWDLDLDGGNKVILRHTQALRTMARTGNINPLKAELCNYSTKTTRHLKTGHISDINRIGFAPQLEIEGKWIVAMYHPNNYPDHFIIYNLDTKDWERWEENGTNPRIYSKGNGD